MRLRAKVLAAVLANFLAMSPSNAPGAPPENAPSGAPPAPPTPAVTPPKLLSDATVGYPEDAHGDAVVVLKLTINADGTVRSAAPAEVNEPFSSQAVGAALGWTFGPAKRNGAAVAAVIAFEVRFSEPEPAPDVPSENDGSAPSPAGAPERAGAATRSASPPPAAPTEVVIRGEKPEPSRSATLSRAEVRQIPGTFGDPFRAIEVMPGVTPVVSGLPFFFVRGAPPGDVGYFLDGIRVPLLFHVGVGPSVVHPGLIERVDLYPGGYPARFGRYSGGIVSGETVTPVPRLHGEYNVRLFDAGALAEAPFANERGSMLVGGRYSYTAALVSLLATQVKLDYWDYQARVSYDVSPVDRLTLFSFGSYDYLGQPADDGSVVTVFGTEFHRIDVRYDHALREGGNVRLAATVGLDRTRLPGDRFVRDRMAGLRSEITYRASPAVLVRAGTDLDVGGYDVELNIASLDPAVANGAGLFPTRVDVAIGARIDAVLALQPGFEVTPGVRFDMFASQGAAALAVDPRLATRLALSKRTRLLSALGVAHQPPAFAVPVPGFQPGGLHGGLQQALQESFGLETDVNEATTATATVFHNAFFNMSDPSSYQPPQLNGCPPGLYPTDSIGSDRGGNQTGNPSCLPRFLPGTLGRDGGGGGATTIATALETRTLGTAYGLELFLKRRMTSKVGGFLSYTLSHSVRSVGRNSFVANFDRTHVVNAALAYDLGRKWRAGTRVTFYTGLPKAPSDDDPSTRLPSFFRIDLRLEKRWQLGERTWISFVAEWMNATLSKEAVGTNCTLQGCTPMTVGPITIPSLGVEGGF